MSGKKKEPRVFLFNFSSGYPRWYYRIPRADYPAVYDPRFYDTRFSGDDAVGPETWSDQGVDLGKAPSTMFGQRLGQDMLDLLPKTILVGGFADNPFDEYLRDINVTTDGEFNVHRLVSQRLKNVIEAIEPGVHQFTPVRFVNYVTRAPIWTDIPWYILNITTWIAPDVMFDCEAMGLRFRLSEPYGHFPGETLMGFPVWFHSKKYVVRRSTIHSDIGARHLWVTSWYFTGINRRVHIEPAVFCSDTFRSACMAAGLKGGRFIKLAMSGDQAGTARASSPRGGSFGGSRIAMSSKKKEPKVFWFNFSSGSPTWGYGKGDDDDRGVYDPRFSSMDAGWRGPWPDPGVAPGKAPNLMFGERLGQDVLDLLPKTIRVGGHTPETRGKHPRDINIITDGEFGRNPIVSQRLKDVIEDLEPGVHQFAPVGFVNRVTDAPIWTEIPWYFLNITTWIAPDVLFDWGAMGDALDFRVNGPYEQFPGETVMSFPLWFQYKKYVVRRSAILSDIGARHLWVTNRYYKAIDRRVNIEPASFCSETFRRACKAAGLKGGHFIQLATERPDEEARYVGPWSDALRKAEREKRMMRWDLRLGERVEPTTMQEALSLARALLDDPVQGALLRRVGVHGDWDWEIEHQRLQDFITRHAKAAGWGQRDPDTLHVIVAFARRIAAGQFAPDSPQARDWLAFNIHNGTHYRIHEGLAQAHVQEIFHLARTLQNDPAIVELLREMLDRTLFRSDEAWAEYQIFEKKYAIKYGLCHRNRLTEAIRLVHKAMKGELPSVDGDEAYEHLKTYCGNPDLPRARYDGICNV